MKEAHYPVRCPRDIGLSHSAGHATFNHRVAFQPRLVGCVLLSLVPHSLWLIACHLESCLSIPVVHVGVGGGEGGCPIG